MADGSLYIVATPIGNLQDISLRAIEVLGSVDLVAAEDTRHTRQLLAAHGIEARLVACHEHNEQQVAGQLLRELQAGRDVALVSDAGTPLVSDPGYRLVRQVREAGLRCVPVPGASALLAALSAAGLPSDRFHFEGFLPAKSAARQQRLKALHDWPHTVVVYESPRRLPACLEDMVAVYGDHHEVALCRELTKQFETILVLPLAELVQRVREDADQQRGECVLLLGPPGRDNDGDKEDIPQTASRLFRALCEELPASQAARVAAKVTGVSRQRLYKLADSDQPG